MDLKIYSKERNSRQSLETFTKIYHCDFHLCTFSLFVGGLLENALLEVHYSTEEVLLSPTAHAHSYWLYTVNFA
jgi:hypothetical protein